MTVAPLVIARLLNQTAAENRVTPIRLPDGSAYPAITYQDISTVRQHAMGQDGPLVKVRVQVNMWGTTYGEAASLADAVAVLLNRFKGTVGSLDVQDVFLDAERTAFDDVNPDKPKGVIQDYIVFLRV